MRLILVTGKGGVGKTTIASATALRAAAFGHRVLLTSTDRAHSLSDALADEEVGHGPRLIRPNCWARELSVPTAARESWEQIARYLQDLLQTSGAEAIDAEELSVVPGAEELLALADLRSCLVSDDYDLVVVDCAPSAETLRLLNVPHVLQLLAARLGLKRAGGQLVGRVIASGLNLPPPDRATLRAVDELERQVVGLNSLLASPQRTTARIVTTPERVVVRETLRTYTYLSLFGYLTDAVIVNRVFPDDGSDLVSAVHRRQAEQLDELDLAFGNLMTVRSPLRGEEPVGSDHLLDLGTAIFPDDPSRRLSSSEPLSVAHRGDERVLTMPVPGHRREQIALRRDLDDVQVTIGDRSRTIALPDSLRRRTIVDAGLRDGRLELVFGAAS